ncbi:MAG: immunoglobulin domain-containing protein, partial [Acidimicrobiia bacterium]
MSRTRTRAAGPIAIVVACVAALLGVASTPAVAQTTATGPFVVNVGSREEVRRFFQTVYRAAENVPAGWTGDVATCNAGTLSPAFLDATLSRVNWFRAMAGVSSDITFTAEKNALAQAAGVLQAANPGPFNHEPPNTWRCFSQAGFDGSRLSNLGGTGPGGIDGWMFDNGGNNAATGHRRHILNPAQITMGHGGVPGGAGALHVLGESATPRPVARDGFVAWPNRGFVPYSTVYSRWTFSLPPTANVANATVTMRRGGADVPLTIIFRESASGFGDSAINWRPTTLPDDSHWPRPTADETYTVTVANVVIDGVARTFTYDVTIFDPQVADPSETRAVISGPDRPTLGQPAAYTFNAVPNATGYQWRSVKISPFLLTDGAEAGLANFVPELGNGAQDPLPYNPISTEIPGSGAASFRLTSSVVGGPQRLTLNRRLLAGATSRIAFRSRAEMLDNHAMRVEVSVDGGTTWTPAFDQTAPLGREGAYSDKVVSLAAFAGQLVQVRFALVQTGGATWTCCGAIGWYLDDITFQNLEQAAPEVLSATAAATGFTFTPTEAGDYLLQVHPEFFSTGFGDWGPSKRVTATPPVVAPTITTQPAGATVTAGTPVTLSVVATGTAPLRFAWRRDGVALVDGAGVAGATTATLTVTPAVAGSYTVVVSNDAGTVTSNAAVVVVNQPPPPPPGLTLGDAIDNAALAPVTSGDAAWTAQRAVTRDGVDA